MRVFVLVLGLAAAGCASQPVRPETTANAGGTRAFDHRPQPGEKAICPVSGEHFVVAADTTIVQYHGKYYAFCCSDCPKEFKANPSKFAP